MLRHTLHSKDKQCHPRWTSGMVAMECAQWTATGRPRTGEIYVDTGRIFVAYTEKWWILDGCSWNCWMQTLNRYSLEDALFHTWPSGATWAPTQTAAGWATGARTRAWGDALHQWEVSKSSLNSDFKNILHPWEVSNSSYLPDIFNIWYLQLMFWIRQLPSIDGRSAIHLLASHFEITSTYGRWAISSYLRSIQ